MACFIEWRFGQQQRQAEQERKLVSPLRADREQADPQAWGSRRESGVFY